MIGGKETPGEKTVRLSLEKRLEDYYQAGDMTQGNEVLDYYPYNTQRPNISLEQARHVATHGLDNAITEIRKAA